MKSIRHRITKGVRGSIEWFTVERVYDDGIDWQRVGNYATVEEAESGIESDIQANLPVKESIIKETKHVYEV